MHEVQRYPWWFGVLLFAILASGCDTLNWQQYRVSSVPANSADAARLKQVVAVVAARHALQNATATSTVDDTLVFYTEPNVEYFHTDLGVRLRDGDAIIDVMAGFGPRIRKVEVVGRALERALTTEFGARCERVAPEARVRIE